MTEYAKNLLEQYKNLDLPNVRALYSYMYSLIANEFTVEQNILEVGAGLGGSAKFLKSTSIIRTDIIESKTPTVIGSVDMHNLPFSDNYFDGLFALDAIHHCEDPALAMREMFRVCKDEGKVVIIEPYVSFLSYPFYKLFHSEDVSWKLDPESLNGVVDARPNAGNQTILQALLKSRYFQEEIQSGRISILSYQKFAPFSLYITGGINNPLPTSESMVKSLINFEQRIPPKILEWIASRQAIILKKVVH